MTVLHVVFRVAQGEYVLPASEVLDIEPFTKASPVTGAAPYVAGTVPTRGRAVQVIDLRLRFGLPHAPATFDSRVLFVDQGTRLVGLLVDGSHEIVRLEPAAKQHPSDGVPLEVASFVTHVVKLRDRLLFALDAQKLVGDP